MARKHKSLTQEELAKILGIPQQNIARWEKGERIPSAKNLIKISRILDVSIDWLLMGESSFMVKDKRESFKDEIEKIYSVMVQNQNIKNLFVFLADISINFKKEINELIKAGFTYNEAILYLAIKHIKENKKSDKN